MFILKLILTRKCAYIIAGRIIKIFPIELLNTTNLVSMLAPDSIKQIYK